MFYIWRSKHVWYVTLSPIRENSAWLSFDMKESILYESCCLGSPSRPLFLPHPNSRHYPPSFSKPLVWTDAWPFPNSACPCPGCLSHARSQIGNLLFYIYRSSVPLGLAWIKWQWFPKQRQEVWPILWSATSSNRCRSEWINGDAEPQCIVCWAPDPAAELFCLGKYLIFVDLRQMFVI